MDSVRERELGRISSGIENEIRKGEIKRREVNFLLDFVWENNRELFPFCNLEEQNEFGLYRVGVKTIELIGHLPHSYSPRGAVPYREEIHQGLRPDLALGLTMITKEKPFFFYVIEKGRMVLDGLKEVNGAGYLLGDYNHLFNSEHRSLWWELEQKERWNVLRGRILEEEKNKGIFGSIRKRVKSLGG